MPGISRDVLGAVHSVKHVSLFPHYVLGGCAVINDTKHVCDFPGGAIRLVHDLPYAVVQFRSKYSAQ
jgi:hypothetical protein